MTYYKKKTMKKQWIHEKIRAEIKKTGPRQLSLSTYCNNGCQRRYFVKLFLWKRSNLLGLLPLIICNLSYSTLVCPENMKNPFKSRLPISYNRSSISRVFGSRSWIRIRIMSLKMAAFYNKIYFKLS
jgi:hypothetical protein